MIVDTLLPVGTVLEGRYGVLRALNSQSSTSRYYEGRQINIGRRVVLKTIGEVYEDSIQAKQQLEQFALESRILAALTHPNLPVVYDFFLHDGLPVIVSEFVDGRRLQEIVELAPKMLSSKRVLAWAEQILDALGYLHAQDPPIIVRDLKPSNVILGRDGRIRLVDFGLAKRMSGQGAGTQEIVKGLGTDGYAPLEQTAYAPTTPATDLYALGATLYFLLTKLDPPTAAQRTLSAKEPLRDARSLNDTVSDELWQSILELMAIRAQERPQSVAVARELLMPKPLIAQGRRCLDCDLALDLLVRQGVEIDRCPGCGGIWLDHDELEVLIALGMEGERGEVLGACSAPTLQLAESRDRTVRLDDIELPATNRVWQFLREVLGR